MDRLSGHKLFRKTGNVVPSEMALEDKKIILYFFSARWCPPCRAFLPILVDFYSELVKEEEPIEIIFVSGDDNQDEMKTYMKEHHGDWLAIQQGTALASDLKKQYKVTGMPSVIVVTKDGQLISRSGRSEITDNGVKIFQNWLTAAKAS
ncbi:hypothetical protein TCAL_05657 [Tigriopus californicus]|uniref:Thioredoxin domain-containing protein n=1 Tax=Tigriopus californicus TaxID=6832 RepID=A0A553PD02_TIGCA|nr:nucleoredoxin-like protein 2 [Tigriopus californicus]TRY75555.1 hypothetical protein TCAL_05657 [Tigriopus californicus]|eukprot:TCALIF_05657-PA protein Name:"Similar to Nxnl2 Nucleoredoxin-like protein 2 (Mus musculus)" AED:0.00 eAED:0.00 QI:70/1/1/1/1/1/3/52/148